MYDTINSSKLDQLIKLLQQINDKLKDVNTQLKLIQIKMSDNKRVEYHYSYNKPDQQQWLSAPPGYVGDWIPSRVNNKVSTSVTYNWCN